MARPIIIDTDPGIDDALAVLFALRSPELEVVAFTSIFGNCSTERSTTNIGRLQRFADVAAPTGVGARRPLFGPGHPPASFVHGEDGLGDCGLAGPWPLALPLGDSADPAIEPDVAAATLIIETVRARPGEVTIVALGPLTNLALALALEPRVAELTAEVVIMGGAHGVPGNAGPLAEANIIHDVYAAEQVLAADWPTVLIPLDVTNRVVMTSAYLDRLGADGGAEGRYLREVTRFYEAFHRRTGVDGIHAHDPTAMMWLVAPDAFRLDEGPATVAIGGPAHGQTVIDRRGGAARPVEWDDRAPIRYGVDADANLLLEVFRSRFCP